MPTFAIPAILRANWKLIGIGLLIAALVVQSLRLDAAQERVKRYQAEISKLEAEAKRQKTVTKANVERAREGMKQVEAPARRVETAPLPGGCRSPIEILEADL